MGLINYATNLTTRIYHKKSLLGALLLFSIILQCISGVMLSFYYISEPMIIPFTKNEEDMMDLYNDDFLYIHERLVDIIFILMYMHMYRKVSYNVYSKHQINAWVSGATLWFLIHLSIFFGLTLACTHLSDVTLTIAANIMQTFTFKVGKVYWILFTNKTLNSDTVVRIAYAHYIISLSIFFLSFFHSFEMHYDWKNGSIDDGVEVNVSWFSFVVKEEISFLLNFFSFFYLLGSYWYYVNEPLTYEIFLWGDVGLINDVRFLGVAPHWYFRAYMGWLIVCPHHYIGIFGLVLYIVIIYFQVYIKKINYLNQSHEIFGNNIEYQATHLVFYVLFLISVMYTSSILPYGKFYNRIGGNVMLLVSYFFILIFLTKPFTIFFYKFYLKTSFYELIQEFDSDNNWKTGENKIVDNNINNDDSDNITSSSTLIFSNDLTVDLN